MTEQESYAAFMKEWKVDPLGAKSVLQGYIDLLSGLPGVSLSYRCRPGVSYSVRAKGAGQTERDLFVLVDVVDDDPAERWLSVCFYADMIKDPEELGDWVPQGLAGEDAACFNYDEENAAMEKYIAERLKEAAALSCKEGAK